MFSRPIMSRRGFGSATVFTFLIQALLLEAAAARECSASLPIALRPSAGVGVCGVPIDDDAVSYPGSYSPWTHAPSCHFSVAKPGKKFCTFTNSRHGARGVSILTTPQTAANNADMLNELISAPARDRLPYKIVEVPGKGMGVVALRRFKRYEQIMLDYATLLVDISFASEIPAQQGYRLLRLAVDQLSEPSSVLELGQSNSMARDAVENVLRTNAFHTILGDEPHMALYPDVSRINHACKPNAYTRFIPKSQQVSVAAAKDIQPGEEITISYITLGQTYPERKEALQLWGFNCTCSLCMSSPAQVAASDERRRQIADLRSEAISAFQTGRSYQALRITRQVVNLLPAEELFPLYSEQYENMARVYFVLRDREKAEKYAKLSLDVLAEQGYIDRVKPELLDTMWKRFADEQAGKV